MLQLHAKEMAVSDHALLLLKCQGRPTALKIARFESLWFKYEEVASIIQHIWEPTPQSHASNAEMFQAKIYQLNKR
jgi:hypothetical protein